MNQFAKIVRNGGTDARARLALLGRAHAADSSGHPLKIPRMGLTLAAYLLLEGSTMRASRESAARFLWEGLEKERQSGNLRQLLLRVRGLQASLGVRLFDIDDDEIALKSNGADIDVAAFRAAIPADSESRIATICERYAGDLLGGMHENGEKLSAWLSAKRALLRAEFVGAVLPFIESREDDGGQEDPSGGLRFHAATRLIAVEPFQEAGYRALMRTYAARGDNASVRRLYERLERLLGKELGCRPSAATRDLYQTLSNIAQLPPVIAAPQFESEPGARAPSVKALPAAGGLPRIAIFAPAPTESPGLPQDLVNDFLNELASRLSQTRSFVVMLPGPAPAAVGPPAIADVDYAVEVRARRGGAPGMIVRLVGMATREILWAGDFESADAIADAVATMVHSIVGQIENRELQLLEAGPDGQSAYRLSIKGQRLLRTIDLPSIRRARALFKAAIGVTANHIPALAGMAHSYVLEWLVRMNPEPSLLDTAERIARMILSISPDDYRGFHKLGYAQLYSRKFDKSVENLRHSMRLNPIDLDVQVDLADALISNGDAREAIRLFAESKQLGRRGADNDHWILAGGLYQIGEYRAALDEIANMQNPLPALRLSAASHAMLGERVAAQRLRAELMEYNPGFKLAQWLSIMPCRDVAHVQQYSEGLRMAGFA
ncbi:MAG: BTAD domain-containing putative transcriptional regulator [Roseiarcus sp.]|jgi:DNA-binding SARP family transcriptional activator